MWSAFLPEPSLRVAPLRFATQCIEVLLRFGHGRGKL